MKNIKELIQKILRKTGFQLEKYPHPDADLIRRFKIINYYNIDTIFDIGAASGQYATDMRKFGYSKKIISFEPLKGAFNNLKNASLKDKNWIVNNYALGNEDIKSVINVAGNSDSSSILNMLPMHHNIRPESKYIAREEIEIRKLDSIFDTYCKKEDRIMIKIDTQGYEEKVIEGATKSLNSIGIIQLEMSIVPLYENEILFIDMIDFLNKKGFQLFSLESGFSDPVIGRLLQVDGIFVNKTISDK